MVFYFDAFAAYVLESCDCTPIPVLCLPLPLCFLRYVTVLALHAIEICPQQVIQQVPTRHLLHCVLSMNLLSVGTEVMSKLRCDGHGPISTIVVVEERLGRLAGDDTSALDL